MINGILEFFNLIYSSGWVPDRVKKHLLQYILNILMIIGLLYAIANRDDGYVKKSLNEGRVLKTLAENCNNGDDGGNKCFASFGTVDLNNIEELLNLTTYEEKKYLTMTLHKVIGCESYYNRSSKRASFKCPDYIQDDEKYKPQRIDREKLSRLLLLSTSSQKKKCGSFKASLIATVDLRGVRKLIDDLDEDIARVTYCYDGNNITLLTQVKNHKAIKYDSLSRFGCENNACLSEVAAAHEERKKIFR
jgi:hypothetical protein